MDNFDLKKYLIENKLTRLSEQDDDFDFDLTGTDWGKSSEQETWEQLILEIIVKEKIKLTFQNRDDYAIIYDSISYSLTDLPLDKLPQDFINLLPSINPNSDFVQEKNVLDNIKNVENIFKNNLDWFKTIKPYDGNNDKKVAIYNSSNNIIDSKIFRNSKNIENEAQSWLSQNGYDIKNKQIIDVSFITIFMTKEELNSYNDD